MTAERNMKNQEDIPIIAEEETVYHARVDGKLLESRYRPKLIDLFAGAGGMTLGFTKLTGHSFQPVWANDFNEYAAKTYNANFGNHCTVGDIVDILQNPKTVIPNADVERVFSVGLSFGAHPSTCTKYRKIYGHTGGVGILGSYFMIEGNVWN